MFRNLMIPIGHEEQNEKELLMTGKVANCEVLAGVVSTILFCVIHYCSVYCVLLFDTFLIFLLLL